MFHFLKPQSYLAIVPFSTLVTILVLLKLLDGETLRKWIQLAYKYPDGSGFSYLWELVQLGNYTLRTNDGVINGYNSEFQMAVRYLLHIYQFLWQSLSTGLAVFYHLSSVSSI